MTHSLPSRHYIHEVVERTRRGTTGPSFTQSRLARLSSNIAESRLIKRLKALWLALFGPTEQEHRFAPGRRLSLALLLCVVVLAGFLRIHRLGDLPAGFFCDEAGLGYNAYSLLKTARDENGAFLPLFIWSFDTSYKNPVFIYSAIVPVALFGLTEFAVRLTSAVYGTATVLAIFFLGRALMGSWVGLLAAAFLAVCPWHLHFSRIAFELITFPFFFVLGITCLVRYAQGRKLLPLGTALFGVCVYTYAVAKLFVPLFLGGFVLLYARTLFRRFRESLVALVVLAATVTPLVLFDLNHADRVGQYFTETTILDRQESLQENASHFFDNYKAFLSWEFLFEKGDWIDRHAVRNHGELYPLFAPFLFIGLLVAFCRNDTAMRLQVMWLLFYPISAALMNEIPSASRGFIGAPVLCLLTAIGAGSLLRLPAQVSSRRRLVIGTQLSVVLVSAAALFPQVQHYWRLYTQEYPTYAAKYYTGFQFGHRDAVHYFLAHREEYDRLLLTVRMNNQPQSFLLFYSAYDPALLHSDGLEAFERETRMSLIDPQKFFLYPRKEKILLAARAEELPLFAEYTVKYQVTAPDGSPAFVLIEPKAAKNFARSWWVSGPYPFEDDSPPPGFDPGDLSKHVTEDRPWLRYSKAQLSVDMNTILTPEEHWTCGWAVNMLYVNRSRTVHVLAGFDTFGDLWVNDEYIPLYKSLNRLELVPDSWSGTTDLEEGHNTVAVRNCGSRDEWRFYFRLTEPDGSRLEEAWWEY